MGYDLSKRVKDAFAEEGIEIPYPHMDVTVAWKNEVTIMAEQKNSREYWSQTEVNWRRPRVLTPSIRDTDSWLRILILLEPAKRTVSYSSVRPET